MIYKTRINMWFVCIKACIYSNKTKPIMKDTCTRTWIAQLGETLLPTRVWKQEQRVLVNETTSWWIGCSIWGLTT
jgi:hypothetical protein